MADKPWHQKSYTLIVVPNAQAKMKKLKIPYWLMTLGITSVTVVVALIAVFSVHYWLMLDKVGQISQLAEDNIKLKKENSRYRQLTAEINHRMDLISEKTKILSILAGVKPVETTSLGDISGFEDRIGNEQLDRDLPVQGLKLSNYNATLERVEESFNQSQENLDYTPSLWPLITTRTGYISSSMGNRPDPFTNVTKYHKGIDVSCDLGTPIIAPANGIVVRAEKFGGLGNVLKIDHHNGYETVYGHLKLFNVKKGERVTRGQVIGFVGRTGRATGPHLHYEVRYNKVNKNPRNFILNFEKIVKVWDFQ